MSRVKNFLSSFFRTLRKRWKLVGLILIILAIGGFILLRRQQSQKETVTYVKPEVRNLTKTLEVSGIVDAEEKASMRFAMGGKVTYLGAQEGATVRKGQLVAQIDPRELQQRMQQDLNSYMQERLDWEQTLDDNRSQVFDTELQRQQQQSQLDLNNAVLGVEIRDTAIRDTRLVSPLNGILVAMPTTITGVNLAATDAFELVNPNTLVFKAAIDEADIADVAIGQSAQITLDAYPEETLDSQVEFISPKSQNTSTSTVFIVRLPMSGDPTLSKYRLGMNGDVTLSLETKNNVLSLPIDATRERDGKTYVDVKEGETNVEREITIGLETDDYVEVLSGVTANDEVVMPDAGETE